MLIVLHGAGWLDLPFARYLRAKNLASIKD
jgi:hypothetical protein